MKILFLVKIIFLSLIFQNYGLTKGLPPGTGSNDIPANVLILLDKSGSMTTSISTGGITRPQAVAVDSNNSDSYVGMSSSIVKVIYDTMEVDDSWSYAGSTGCEMGDIKELRIHNNKLYVIDHNKDNLFRIDLTSQTCDWSVSSNNPISMDIKNNILYSLGDTILVYDLSSATPSNIDCSSNYTGNLEDDGKNAKSLAIDSSGSNLYLHRSGSLKRYVIDSGSKCPSSSRSNSINTSGANTVHGFIFEPGSDTVIYLPDYNDEFYKVTLNASKNGTSSIVKGNIGWSGAIASTLSPNRTNVDYPYGIDIDTANNRVHFVSRGCCKHSMHVIDYDQQFIKETGGGVQQTRMSGAVEAIQAIVTDSALTSHVDFGFGVWSESGASFTGWNGDITTGTAIPCPDKNCLRVRVHREGAGEINTDAPTIVANGGSTYSKSFADLASQYYLHGSLSPIDDDLDCQNSHVIIIGDGDFTDNISNAKSTITTLNISHNIKTHSIAYGGGISASGLVKFEEFAVAGGTDDVIIANTPNSLKTQLRAKITQLIADNFAFTAPSIPPSKNETSTAVYQSSFKHKSKQSWRGELIRTTIDSNGVLNLTDPDNWTATDIDKLPDPDDRKIWTVLTDTTYLPNYNNFVAANSDEISDSLRTFNFEVQDYHSVTGTPTDTRRCASSPGVADGNNDDVKGLINFLRGQDYFDYDADCDLTEQRLNSDGDKVYLGDFYHSELLVVGAPSANTSYTDKTQEAYWRSINGYDGWASHSARVNRKEIIYVGGNDGMLHAFNAESGAEEWAFIPPLLSGNLPTMVDKAMNKTAGGGTNAIYGVDGSPIVHDMFFEGPFDSEKVWHTILMIPYGRGGNGFSVLDVTDPDAPLHLLSIYNDPIAKVVHTVKSSLDDGDEFDTEEYVANSYVINELKEAIKVIENANATPPVGIQTCDDTTNNQCYLSTEWTLETNPKIPGLTKSDFSITKDGDVYDDFTISYDSNGDIVFSFDNNMRFMAYSDPSHTNTDLRISITDASKTGVTSNDGAYDYSRLGETWSAPRIFRMPNEGAGDALIDDDMYVAVLGGGFGANNPDIGSNIFIINLEDKNLFGKVEKQILIEDISTNGIINSTPALPTVITSDEISTKFTGALVYLNDLEGKVTKFNLTNMTTDNQGVAIEMYDSTTLFNVEANTTNGRYMYHSMDAGTVKGSNTLMMFLGTGDYERLTDKNDDVDNVLIGIKDIDFPYYKNINTATTADTLDNCSDTTNDDTGDDCPTSAELGWKIHLDSSRKVTAEPTLTRGRVLFPVFEPTIVDSCSTGKAFICNVHAECGTPKNTEIGSANDLECFEVGTGVLSKVVVFGNKIFANIAGTAGAGAMQGDKDDLVSINAAEFEIESFRNSWRENY